MKRIQAKLVYDSEASNAVVGARCFGAESRTLLFGTSDILVDMNIQNGGGGMKVLHGELLSASREPLPGVEIAFDGQSVITDRYGEFAATLENDRDTQIEIRLPYQTIVCAVTVVEAF